MKGPPINLHFPLFRGYPQNITLEKWWLGDHPFNFWGLAYVLTVRKCRLQGGCTGVASICPEWLEDTPWKPVVSETSFRRGWTLNNKRGDLFNWLNSCTSQIFGAQKRLYIPRTQMTPVLIGKGLVLRGSTFKNRGHLGSRYRLGMVGFIFFAEENSLVKHSCWEELCG